MAALALIYGLLALSPQSFAAATPQPMAIAGELSAPDWDFGLGKPLEIVGEWQVIWGELVEPSAFRERYQGALFTLPSRWNEVDHPALQGSYGAATFRVKLRLPDYQAQVAYHMIAAHSAYRLYIDGELVVENGAVTESAQGFVANNVSRQFPGKSGESEIILQVANFVHAYGGPGHALKLYDAQALKQLLDTLSVIYGLVVGIIFTIGLFHLILYLADRKDSNAAVQFWFSILCFIIVYRVQGIIPLVHEYFHDTNYWRNLRFPYASLYAAPAVYLLFFRALFPAQFPPRSTLIIVSVASLGLLFTLTQSEFAYTSTRNFAIWLNVIVIVYSLLFTIRAVLAKIRGARVILVANAVFLVTAVYDAIIYTDQSSGFDLTPFGILILGLGYSYALFLGLQSRFFEARQDSAALESLNTDLEQQVQDRTLALQAAAAKAENAASDKARFIAAASHDLRQPLHALSLFNNALKHKLKKSDAAPLLERQENAISNLGNLLQDTLDAARLDSKQKPLNIASISSATIRDKLVDSFAERALSKGVALSFDVEQGELQTDLVMLQRILSNLLDNALKAAERTVSVNVKQQADGWCFRIEDDGRGISQSDMNRVFKSYVSLDGSSETEQGGYGLGLYVVKEFTETLGGTISVQSSLGLGSVFELFLPMLDNAIAQDARARHDPANIAALEGVKILAIDDDMEILEAISAVLSGWGCEFRTANGHRDINHIIEAFQPQVLLLDYHLQASTGLELMAKIEQTSGRSIPAIVITGATEHRILQMITAAGLTVLEKPVKPEKLAEAILAELSL